MKRLLSFLLLFILFMQTKKSYAQGENFAPIGAEWYYSWANHSMWLSDDLLVGYIRSVSVKDTTLDGVHCRQIENTRVFRRFYPPVYQADTIVSYSYVYANSDTVFYFNENFSRFLPLYIYNANVGDTVLYRGPEDLPSNDTIFKMRIDSIVTDNMNGYPIKTYYQNWVNGIWGFGPTFIAPYMERIGSMDGFLTTCHSTPLPLAEYVPEVRCYRDNEVNYQRYSRIPCHFFGIPNNNDSIAGPPGTGLKEMVDERFSLFPNPSNDGIIHIETADNSWDLESIIVYSADGRAVHSLKHTGNRKITLVLSHLPKGLYWIKIIGQSKFHFIHKLIIH